MKKVTIVPIICLLIGISLGSFITRVQFKKDTALREKIITDQAGIIKGQEVKNNQLQAKLNEQQEEIKRQQIKLTEQEKKFAQANTVINQKKGKQTTDDKSLEKLLEEMGEERILSP